MRKILINLTYVDNGILAEAISEHIPSSPSDIESSPTPPSRRVFYEEGDVFEWASKEFKRRSPKNEGEVDFSDSELVEWND